ncbi:ATP-dependent DNA helicase RecQ-like [Saccostrea cucullata]|uniref:ATP-dependent DNA helicase RecQ-like n=1 Tax=Saccostrea cuccullata TaxID=36930 RepID=UPI002ED67D00
MAASKFTQDDIDAALVKFNERTGRKIVKLKPKQYSALLDVLNGHDVIAALPTGYGKSLIYELIPYVLPDAKVIVVEPLNVIINQQISKLDGMAVVLKDLNISKTIEDGQFSYSYVYSHPENILGKPLVNKFFQCKYFEENRVVIVIDEAHCILEWGDEFRPEYSKLVELWAVLPHANMLCLSATLSVKGQADIQRSLSLKDFRIHGEIPVKSNISLSVLRRPSNSKDVRMSYRHILDVLFNELKNKLSNTPLTIVYFNSSLNYIGFAYEHACRVLGDLLYNGEKRPENARIVMYHASVEYGSEELRELIFHQISSEKSPLRIILASSALGMGADFGLVERIVHAGPPKSTEAYIQQVGRAGRTGKQATAILFFNNSDVGRPEMSKTMKAFCKNESTCRRKMLNDYFGCSVDNKESENKQPLCCNICDPSLSEWNSSPHLKQEVKSAIQQSLSEYISHNELQMSFYEIESVIHNYSRYMEKENLIQDFRMNLEHAENLCTIIKFIVSM